MSNITYNKDLSRYEMSIDGETVFANVRKAGNTLYIDYVEAPPALRGTGATGKLMQGLMDSIKNDNLKVVPICGYAAAWMERHPQ